MNEPPTFDARVVHSHRDGSALVEFDCPHCRTRHTHGLPAGDRDIGHRAAHCANGPYMRSGYVLRVVDEGVAA